MKKMLHRGFNPSKCKTSLKMASSRVKLLRNKKGIQLTQLKREVAQLLQTGQDQTARIRVEHVVREEKTITAYELIDLYCELIVARLPIIETQKHCPIDLKEAIASIIFASPRCSDIPELMDIRKHFTAKYGKEFVTAAVELRPDSGVNRSLIEKLSAVAPDGPTKVKILTGIAEEHNIKWEPDWFKDNVPEPPAYMSNAPNTDKISQMDVEPQTVQASPRFEPKPEIPSNTHHVAEPENSKFVHSSPGPSGTVTEPVKSNQSYNSEENSSFGAKQKWNMEFKDASAAAQAAAESAEMASMAARAAAEIANRDRPNSSRMQHVLADPKRTVKASAMMDDNNFDRPNSSQQSVQKDGIQPNSGKRSSSEFIPYAEHKESLGQYDEEQYVEEVKVQHGYSAEDSEFRSTFTDSNSRHGDDSVENPLYGETWETRNQPKSYQSQPSSLSETYGNMPSSDPPKFDDDLYEDPFDTNRRDILYKEDLEREEPYTFHSTFSQDQKDDVHEQRKYSSDSDKNLFSEEGDYSIQEEKGSTKFDDAPHFDDDGSDEDDYIQSPGRKSPEYSSPDEERSPKKFGILSSKHLYQPELSESFKKSSIYSQLVKPISLGDDSESDEEVQKEVEDSTVEQHSEEILEEDSFAKSPGSGSTRSRSDAKSYDRSSFSRLLEEAERLSSPRRSSLPLIPDTDEDFQDSYQSKVELNVESLSGGLKNKGLRLPPYTKGISPYSSSSSILTVDDAPKVSSDDEIKEILGKREESIRKKKNLSLQGTYFDPKGDDNLVDERSSPKVAKSYIDSEDVSSGEESVKRTVPSKYQAGAVISRRTRASGQSRGQTETRSSYKISSDTESVTGNDTYSAKEKTRSKMSSGEEISSPSVAVKPRSSYKISSDTESVTGNDTYSAKPKTRSKMSSGEEISSPSVAVKPRSSYKISSDTESVTGNDTYSAKPKTRSKMSSGEEISSPSAAVKPRSSYKISSDTESVTGKDTSSAKPRTRSGNKNTRSSNLSKMSSGEEISSPSSTSYAGVASAKPKTKSVIQMESLVSSSSPPVEVKQDTKKALLRDNSDKKAPHVHPNLPDWDDFASHFQRKNHQ